MSHASTHFRFYSTAPRWAYTPVGIVVLLVGSLLVVTQFAALISVRSGATLKLVGEMIGAASLLLPLPIASLLFREARRLRALRRAWLCFCSATTIVGLSLLLNSLVALGSIPASFSPPRLMTFSSLLALGLIALGMTRVPAEKLPRNLWLPTGLDVGTMLLAWLLCFWVYALYPAFTASSFEAPAAWTVAAFTGAALTLIGLTLILLIRQRPLVSNATLAPLVFGSFVLLTAEILPACNALTDFRLGTTPIFIGWPLFGLALVVASQTLRSEEAPYDPEASGRVNVALPFVVTGLVGFLLFTSFASDGVWAAHVMVLLPATFIALVLIVVRQSLTARENLLLARQMSAARDAAETANNSRLQFLANISHDLRTPLNGVLGCTQILLREKDITKKQRGLVKTMQGCAEHLRNLINDLLDLSKLEADRLELAPVALDLRGFTEALIKTFSLEAEKKGVSLVLDEGDDLPRWIRCDRKRLQQIMGNLIHNAIKFTERGGVWLRLRRRQNRLALEVQDTGFGIHPEKIGELFRPFHIVDERAIKLEGTGLGLSISRKLARKMGGDIEVQSTLGKGSKFIVSIPLEEAEAVVEVQRTIVDYQGPRRRILIVDDQPANRVVLRSLLEPLDFLVDDAGSAAAALEQMQFAKPDIILSDLMMPEMDGFEFCRKIQQLNHTTPIPCIAISAASSDEVRARSLKAGFRELLGKPVHLDMLLQTLQQHAGIEWTYGVIQPAPAETETPLKLQPLVPPSAEEIAVFIDLSRRGVVQTIETRAEQLGQDFPDLLPFVRRVLQFTNEFKVKELAAWLGTLTPKHADKSA